MSLLDFLAPMSRFSSVEGSGPGRLNDHVLDDMNEDSTQRRWASGRLRVVPAGTNLSGFCASAEMISDPYPFLTIPSSMNWNGASSTASC